MLYLKEANIKDIEKEYVFVTKVPADEKGFTNPAHGCTREEFEEKILPGYISAMKGENLPEGYVPCTEYFLWEDDRIIGWFRIRHCLNEFLRKGAGHIGYCIGKDYRNIGYGEKGLKLTIEKAKAIIPESEIYMSAHKFNPASLRVMEKCGAYIHHEDEEEWYTRIRIRE